MSMHPLAGVKNADGAGQKSTGPDQGGGKMDVATVSGEPTVSRKATDTRPCHWHLDSIIVCYKGGSQRHAITRSEQEGPQPSLYRDEGARMETT